MVEKLGLSRIKYLNWFLPLLLALLPITVVFLGEKLVPIFIILIGLLFLLEKNKKQNFITNRSLLKAYLPYIGVYVLFTLFSGDISIALRQLERQLAIFIIPILVFGSGWDRKRINLFLETFLITLIVVCVFSLCKLAVFYFIWSDWIEVSKVEYLQFKFPHLLDAHPTYWSYLLVIGSAILLSNGYLKIRMNKFFLIFTLLLFNGVLLFLSARTSLLVNSLVLLLAGVIYFKNNQFKSYKLLVSFLAIGAISFFIIKFLPFLIFKFTIISEDERFFLWPKAFLEIKNNFFLWGEGVGQGKILLNEYLGQIIDTRKHYNGNDLHNQYLKNYLDMGILGFVALLNMILYPLISTKGHITIFNILGFTISFLFLFGMGTESSLSVLKGIILLSVFSPIILLNNKLAASVQ